MKLKFMRYFLFSFVFLFIPTLWACSSWNTYVDGEPLNVRLENNTCIVTVYINYVKRPSTCTINLKIGDVVNVIVPRQFLSAGCPINGGLYLEGNISYINEDLFLTSGEVF